MNAHGHEPHIGQLAWRSSSYSSEEGGECVEIAIRPANVHVRDSKDTTRAPLAVKPTTWTAFVEFVVL
ncbi:DUF397 domain-containing protein [Streptomyces sp. NPDC055099]